jgi:flagellar protein FlbD
MIKVTQLNGKEMAINAELISHLETTPNTVITLTTGNKIVVRETMDEVIERCAAYKRGICAPWLSSGINLKKEETS